MVLLIRFVLTWTSSSHKEVLDMEIQFLHERATEEDPKLMINCIQKMVSGETPFLPTTLSLVYDKLVEKAFTTHSFFDRYPSGWTKG